MHWGIEAMINDSKGQILTVRMTRIIKSIVKKCEICLKNNPQNFRWPPTGVIRKGNSPDHYRQIDFSELPRQNRYRYLSVLADTFSGWPEAFPCRTNEAREAVKVLMKEVIPRFRVPVGMPSDRGPHFVAEILQNLARISGIQQDPHAPWRPQSSGKVERTNRSLKSKIRQETNLKWPQALPLALLRIRIRPSSKDQLGPYEIPYRKPYRAVN